MFLLYKKFRGKFSGKKDDLEADSRGPEGENKDTKQIFNDEKDRTEEDSTSTDVVSSPLQIT